MNRKKDEDSPVISRLAKTSPQPSGNTGQHVSPLLRHMSIVGAQIPRQESPGTRVVAAATSLTQDLQNLYCCEIPMELMHRDILYKHFLQFGPITRLYLSSKRRSCTVHFNTHDAAKEAKLKGNTLEGHTFRIFWSKPAAKSYRENVASKEVQQSTETSKVNPSFPILQESTYPKEQEKSLFILNLHKQDDDDDCIEKISTSTLNSSPSDKMSISTVNGNPCEKMSTSTLNSSSSDKMLPDMSIASPDRMLVDEVDSGSQGEAMEITVNGVPNPSILTVPSASGLWPVGNSKSPLAATATTSALPLKVSPFPLVTTITATSPSFPLIATTSMVTSPSFSLVATTSTVVSPSRASPSPLVATVRTTTSTSRVSSLMGLIEVWLTKSRLEFNSAEDRYQILELRDKILRLRRVRQLDLSKAEITRGTCQDMCPEKERYQRESRQQIASYELISPVSKEMMMNHMLAVKQYSRSSADQEEPLPHELRPTPVLRMTMDYLLSKIMDRCDLKDENLGEWYFFLWDRTRGIRKEITQQDLCNMNAVNLLEECVRFHIHCSERLVAEKSSVFDSKINSENLTKCLQTLKYMYHDMALKGSICPNEAEFRGYIILLNLNDSNFLWEMNELRKEIIHSKPVQFALHVYTALSCKNYVKFFKLVKETTYLNACILLRYFYQVRSQGLSIIVKSYGYRQVSFPLEEFARLLAFENLKEASDFCKHYDLNPRTANLFKGQVKESTYQLRVTRAIRLIESKRGPSVGEIVKGGPVTSASLENYEPSSSFNANGTLKTELLDVLGDEPEQQVQTILVSKQEQDKLVSEQEGASSQQRPIFQQVPESVKQVKHSEEQSSAEQQDSLAEKAIEDAEVVQCEDVWNQMFEELINEEYNIFCERLENVSILDSDEILLDVTCTVTRDVYKEVLLEELKNIEKRGEEEQRLREEEERLHKEEEERLHEEEEERLHKEEEERLHKEEEERSLEEERLRKEEEERLRREDEEKKIMLENIYQQLTEEILEEVMTADIKDIAEEETDIHNICVNVMREMVFKKVYEDIKAVLEKSILEYKFAYLTDKRNKNCCRKYFMLWRTFVEKQKTRRKCLEDLPVWFPHLSASQQAARLAKPPPGTGTKWKKLEIRPVHEEVIEDMKLFDFAALHLLVRSKNKSIHSKYYKLVMSLPDDEESVMFSKHFVRFVNVAFPETKDLKMESPPTMLERKIVLDCTLTVSMRQLIGVQMLERGVPNEKAVCGMNGLIFVMCHDTKLKDMTRNRLHRLMKLKRHYTVIPVAVVYSKEVALSDINHDLQLNLLSEETRRKFNFKYFLMQKGHMGMMNVFVKAVDWLASVHESGITPYCTTSYFLLDAARKCFWEKFVMAEALPFTDCNKIKMSLYMAVKVHNRFCMQLCNLVIDDKVNSCCVGAPEFAQFLPVHEINSAGYTVMPQYYGSPQYKEMVVKFFRSVEFKMPPTQPLNNKEDLDNLLLKLCEVNGISEQAQQHIFCSVNMSIEHANPRSSEEVVEVLRQFSWILILKIMMCDRMKVISFKDTLHTGDDERPIQVAVDRLKLNEFIMEQWYSFIREGDQEVSKEVLALRNQFGLKRSSYTKDPYKKSPRKRVLSRKSSEKELPPPKRLRMCEDISCISKLTLTEIEKEMKDLGRAIEECSEKQKRTEEMYNYLLNDCN